MQYKYSLEQSSVTDFAVGLDVNKALNSKTPVQPAYLSDTELDLIQKSRKRFFIANPKQLYIFRHTPISVLSTFIYFCILICSVATLLYLEIAFDTELVEGVGEVSTTTPFYHLYLFALAGLLFYKIKPLLSEVKKYDVMRYGLAMLANSFVLTLINMIKLSLFILACILLGSLLFEKSFDDVFFQVLDGSNSDEILALFNIVELLVYGYSLRFCSKSYEE
ncbi:hypothetical protein NI389_05710 [Pseudoalteromonas xiamenensis]|uniref:hypothetical protein n=1 Tax=Pseudoalteromonas xiamenensis TaxID=882626 RepID=UPI0027E41CB3|nr:hypothetical protein [Pseudoalteromonas xiamenensis]WMN60904.1 hypothetical protein NI389_05710 [Pseudoalteromonas xiamenensis]